MRIRVLLLPSSIMPLTVHFCLVVATTLLLLLCSSTSCLGTLYQDCISVTCEGFPIGYPFGTNDEGCGDPDFQLECPPDHQYPYQYPLLKIGGDDYSILTPSYLASDRNHNSMTIVKGNPSDNCNFSANYSSFWSSGSHFQILNTYTNVTLWQHCDQNPWKDFRLCGEDWYYSSNLPKMKATPSCDAFQLPIKKSHLYFINETVLEQGFEITWNVEQNRYEKCGVCQESKGICGYKFPESFLCHCPDGKSHLDKCPGNGGRSKSIIIGCSIGGAALIAIAVVLFLRFLVKRRKQPPPPPPRSSISKVEKFLREYAYEMPTRYSQSDLKKMTNNFAEKLGEGGYGVVYKGKLRNGVLVAVKLLDRHRHTQTQFMNEVATIGRVHHVNLVRLSGYCFESFTSALVYEYMVNGSLEKFIFAGKEKGQVLRWEQLYSIALGTARGIAYLHQDCEKRIIHFDIKPHNILLDSEFTPKVSDFGLAKLCGKGNDHISMTGARGTPGYVAPEVWSRDLGSVTDKSDVYSFGMLLLEIVGGRKNIGVRVSRSSQFYFPEWAFKLLESGELGMRLRGGMETEDEEKARRLTKVGLWCIQYKSTDRPCMSRVVQMLEGNGDDVTTPPLPFNCTADPENPLLSSVVTSSIEIRL